jgi:fatty acid desaturase
MANVTGMASLAELRKEFTVRGWHRKATTRVVSGLLLNFAITLAGFYIFVLYDDLLVRVCAMILSTAGSMGVATNTHTSSHYVNSEKRWVDEFLTFFGYPVFPDGKRGEPPFSILTCQAAAKCVSESGMPLG